MITTELYNGQGLGNQLFCYVMTRVIALDKNLAFGIMHPEKFKGTSLMQLDFGKPVIGGSAPFEGAPPSVLPNTIEHYYCEKGVFHPSGADIRSYDEAVNHITDNTKIDGLFQGEHYFKHRKKEIREWLTIQAVPADPDCCIINFRGGEYVGLQELFLPLQYWNNAIKHMREHNPAMKFRVVTDDVKAARTFFPDFEISHSIKDDYTALQNASYLILSNSSFAFFPAWLNENPTLVIAPKYWARHNVSDGYWSCEYNIVEGWMYQDRLGNLQTYEACLQDLQSYHSGELFDISPPTLPPLSFRKMIGKLLPASIKSILKKFIYENGR